MFTNLTFRMVNSIGIPVSVNLRNDGGIVYYSIEFLKGKDKAKPVKEQHLSNSNSAELLKRIDQLGLVSVLSDFQQYELNEGGDYWQIHIDHMMGQIDLSGKKDSHSVIVPLIQDFADVLDQSLSITQFISPNRLDRLEIEFHYNELDPQKKDSAEEYNTLAHMEVVTLDRQTNSIHYSKRFPARCFHGQMECRCDEDVRHILDITQENFTSADLFEDLEDADNDCPELRFTFTFHDKSVVHVYRDLSIVGLRDMIYADMINAIFEAMLRIFFKQSLFDRRMLLPENLREEIPFYILYREGTEESESESCTEEDEGNEKKSEA